MNHYAMEITALQKLSDYRRQAALARALRERRAPRSWRSPFAFVSAHLGETSSKSAAVDGSFRVECCA